MHSLDTEEIEQDTIIVDLDAVEASVVTINNKLAGTASSGLKTLIEANDVDINNIQTKTNFITITQNVNLDLLESNLATNSTNISSLSNNQSTIDTRTVGIMNNSLSSTLKSTLDANSNAIDAIEDKTDHISVSQAVDLDTMESNIETNNSKNSYPSADATKMNHISITQAVNLDVIEALAIANSAVISDLWNLQNVFCYGRRVKIGSDDDDRIQTTNSEQTLVYKNIIANGITYSSTGILVVPSTGLYHVKAKLILTTTANQKALRFKLRTSSGNIFRTINHLGKEEGSSSSYSEVQMDGPVRLVASTDYYFVVDCDEDGSGRIESQDIDDTSLIIKKLRLAEGYTLPSGWPAN